VEAKELPVGHGGGDVSSRSLEDDLLDIPGVEGAELDGAGNSPAGLRIRIAEGADQRTVGEAIRRVLTKHGLGTDTRLPGESTTTPEAVPEVSQVVEPEAATVSVRGGDAEGTASDDQQESASSTLEPEAIDLTEPPSPVAVLTEAPAPDVDEDPGEMIDLTDAPRADDGPDVADVAEVSPQTLRDVDPSSVGVEASPDPGSWSESLEPIVEPVASAQVIVPAAQATAEVSPHPDGSAAVSRVDRVAVEEGRDGIVVRVSSTDGRSESQASSTEGGVETAVVKAASRLAQPGIPDPRIIEIEDRRVEGVDIVMIVLDVDGTVSAGSAIVVAGRSFALGRATWAALSL